MINVMIDNLHKMLWEYRVDFGNLSMTQIMKDERPVGHDKDFGLCPEL